MKIRSFGLLALSVLAVGIFCASFASKTKPNVPAVPPTAELAAYDVAQVPDVPIERSFSNALVAIAPKSGGGVLALLAAGGLAFYAAVYRTRRGKLVAAINTLPPNWGRNSNGKNLLSSAAVATRFLLGKFGADASHVAVISAASDEPIGVISDEASAAEEELFVELTGLTNRTVPVVAKVATTLNCDLYSYGDGKVTIKPTAAGTYWRVGKGLAAATADGDVIEMLPCRPRKLIVVSALDSANGALGAATGSVAAQAAETEKLGDDVRKLAAALDSDADVALATT